MVQLRPHLTEAAFTAQVLRQFANQHYQIAAVFESESATAVAGYRIGENLAWGTFMYVDDLVTDEQRRGAGHGGLLFDWLVAEAKRSGCDEFHLDSGVQRFAAHRFYLKNGMDISSHHFGMKLHGP